MDIEIGTTIRDILKANAFAKKRAFYLLKDKKEVLAQVFQEFDDKAMIQIRSKIESLLPKEKDGEDKYNQALTDILKIIRGLE